MNLSYSKSIPVSSLITTGILGLTFFITAQSILKPGLMLGHDAYAHATYAKLFVNALNEGQFPVRWVEHVWIGFGQPLFNFYQVGFYYIVFLINTLPIGFLSSIKFSVFALWWMGGIFVYLLTKKWGKLSGLLALIVYLFSPYLILDIFVRNSYPELMALSFVPGLLWVLEKILKSPKLSLVPIFTILLAIILFSHLPTLAIFTPVILGFSLMKIFQYGFKIKSIVLLCIGVLLAIGISTFYLFPAILELDLIQIQKLHSGIFNFNRHFVNPLYLPTYIWGYGGDWWGDSFFSFYLLGVIQWLIISAAITFLIYQPVRLKLLKELSFKAEVLFWILVIFYCGFFMHKISSVFWENLKILEFIQFPWRFFMTIPLITAVLSAMLLSKVSAEKMKIGLILIVFLTNFILIGPFLAPRATLQAEYFNREFNDWKQNPKIQQIAFLEPGYSRVKNLPAKNEFLSFVNASSEVEVKKEIIKNHHLVLNIETLKPENIIINTPYYPGWRAILNNDQLEITPTEKYNFMEVKVPPGQHTLEFKMTGSNAVRIANLISLFSIFAVFALTSYSLTFKYFKKLKFINILKLLPLSGNLAKNY